MIRSSFLFFTLLFTSRATAAGEAYTLSTFAGGQLPVGVPGTSALLRTTRAVALDGLGNLFFTANHAVLRLDAGTGLLSLVAGNGTPGFSGDGGPAHCAQLNGPAGLAVDGEGSIYIADLANGRVRKVTQGFITTVAGNGGRGFNGDDGPATEAALFLPKAVAVDGAGGLYIADSFNHRIRKVAGGRISTLAGDGTRGFGGDGGPATAAQLSFVQGVAVTAAGDLYFSEWDNNDNSHIRKVSGGIITTVAGRGAHGFSGDGGPATEAQLQQPDGLAVDGRGNIYFAQNARIRKIVDGIITTVAGRVNFGYCDNCLAVSAQLGTAGLAVDAAGDIYTADTFTNRIRKISGGLLTTVAGGGDWLGDGGAAARAQVYPAGVAVDSAGDVYIADDTHTLRRVSGGIITTVAGIATGDTFGRFQGDGGPASSAGFTGPNSLAVTGAGHLLIVDFYRVRQLAGGIVTTVAGTGRLGFGGDGDLATAAQLGGNGSVAAGAGDSFYIGDGGNGRVRKVVGGRISTVAGGGSSLADGVPATEARLSDLRAIAVDQEDNVYLADTDTGLIRKVSDGVITTVAGGGHRLEDGVSATSARLVYPTALAFDEEGNLLIADSGTGRIRKLAGGVMTTVAGGGTRLRTHGPATGAQFGLIRSMAVDRDGSIYLADWTNSRVWLLRRQ